MGAQDRRRGRGHHGFTLIELLVVVAVIGILAALAVPNLLNAMHRAKQKRTMADLRSVAQSVEQYAIDHAGHPIAADIVTLAEVLTPIYAREVPRLDGWNRLLAVDSTFEAYTLGSGGKDGGPLNFVGGPTSDLDDAIIYINGQFWQWPEGSQAD